MLLRSSGIRSCRQKRRRIWRAILEGNVNVLVGARSALFLPFPNLGLLVVDEEHEPAFKQMEGSRYHARDMSILRAKCSDIPIILASATPSLKPCITRKQADLEKYRYPNDMVMQLCPK